ncbi:phosphoesterase PA-phosphatase [Mycolicibacterium sp. XJ1819]
MIRWWPPVALTAFVILGVSVGKYSTPLDEWFRAYRDDPYLQWLLWFSKPWVLAAVLAVAVAVAVARRRWRLAAVAVASPALAWALVQGLKVLFGRRKEGFYAYPSGHTTVTVVVWGMVVLVASAAVWSIVAAVIVSLLGMLGQAFVWHYFTDTVGGVLLGTAIVCVAALVANPELTRVKPAAICVTRGG